MRLAALTVTMFALAAAAPAPVAAVEDDPPAMGMRATVDPWLAAMREASTEHWTARSLTGCPDGVVTFIADTLFGYDGYAPIGACRVFLSGAVVGSYFAGARNRQRPVRERRVYVRRACTLVAHEDGHARGATHTSHGLMEPRLRTTPDVCVRLARQLIRRVGS